MRPTLPTLIMQPTGAFIDIGEFSLVQAAADALRGNTPPLSNQPHTWQIGGDGVVLASRLLDAGGATEVVLLVDDRDSAVQQEGFADAWRLWLQWSNLLGARSAPSRARILALSEVVTATVSIGAAGIGAVDFAATDAVSGEWGQLLEYASAQEAALLGKLSAVVGAPLPELGIEVADGIPAGIAWPELSIAVATEGTDDTRAELEAAGWTVVEPEFGAILAALNLEYKE